MNMTNPETTASRPRLYIQEVAPRDGFQNEKQFIETQDKIACINRLSASGFAKIEATSFTSPKAIPALRDAEIVMHEIERNPDVVYTVLVPNVRGAQRALECKVDEVNLVMSVSETHNRANLRMTREQSFEQLSDVVNAVRGSRVAINVSLSTVFGCPMEGDINAFEVFELVGRFAALGVDGVTLCDTTGMAFPTQVGKIGREVRKLFPGLITTMHFHNTRGMALANTLMAIEAGINRFERRWAGWAAAPTRLAPAATSALKNWCTCWN